MNTPVESKSVVLMTTNGRQVEDFVFEDHSQGADNLALPDTAWPDAAIYGDQETGAIPPKNSWVQLLLGVAIGIGATSLLTLYLVVPVMFHVGYLTALADVRAAIEAKVAR